MYEIDSSSFSLTTTARSVVASRWSVPPRRASREYADAAIRSGTPTLFHELDDPARALHEARRVLVPGGRVVLIGQDWDTVAIDSDDRESTRKLFHARTDMITAPWTARCPARGGRRRHGPKRCLPAAADQNRGVELDRDHGGRAVDQQR